MQDKTPKQKMPIRSITPEQRQQIIEYRVKTRLTVAEIADLVFPGQKYLSSRVAYAASVIESLTSFPRRLRYRSGDVLEKKGPEFSMKGDRAGRKMGAV